MNWTKCPVDLLVRISTETWEKPICQPFVLHLAATAFSRDRGTEGFVPSATIDTLAPWSQDGPTTKEVAESLVKCGRWVPCDGGYSLADWEFQRVPQAISEARAEAGRLGGLRSGESRRSKQNEAIASEVKQTKQNEVEERRLEEKRRDQIGEETISPPSADRASPDVPRIPKPRKVPTGDHPELIALFSELFESVTGSKPTIGAKDGAAMARMLKSHHTRPVIEERMRRCFEQRVPEWAWRDGPPTLSGFLSAAVFDKLAAVSTPTNGYHPQPNGRASAMSFLTDP